MNKFDEYSLFSSLVRDKSKQRQAASQTYLTVNTVIFGVLAFLVKDAGFRGWGLVWVSLPLFLVGALACLVWFKIIADFQHIIGWHYEQLRLMEQELPESRQVYSQEWERFFKPQDGQERFGFSRLESWLPRFFFGLYVLYGVGLIVATAFDWL